MTCWLGHRGESKEARATCNPSPAHIPTHVPPEGDEGLQLATRVVPPPRERLVGKIALACHLAHTTGHGPAEVLTNAVKQLTKAMQKMPCDARAAGDVVRCGYGNGVQEWDAGMGCENGVRGWFAGLGCGKGRWEWAAGKGFENRLREWAARMAFGNGLWAAESHAGMGCGRANGLRKGMTHHCARCTDSAMGTVSAASDTHNATDDTVTRLIPVVLCSSPGRICRPLL